MQKKLRIWRPNDILISFVIFAFLMIFTYGLLFVAPYSGFYFNPSDGEVLVIYQPDVTSLMKGDFIERVGSISFDAYHENKRLNLFEGVQRGQPVEIVVRRNGEILTIPWVYPGFNRAEFLSRFFNVWWLAYIFWFVGMSAQLFMRPKDTQWRLFVAINYLTGMFLMLGSISSFQIMGSPILLRFVAWLILPAYIHFHWIFPMPLRRIPQWLKMIFYIACCGIAVGELFLQIPSVLYFFAVILAFGGSIVLLIFHYILQPDHRYEVRLLAAAAFLAMFPAVVISFAGSSGQTPDSGPLSLLALPILPGAYFYVLYRRRLGGLELRANRAMSLYIFLVLIGTMLLLLVGYTGLIDISPEAIVFATVMIALFTAFISILIFPIFQSFIERRLLGIKLPARNMVENYSARIITSTTLPGLLKLLKEEVFPSLFIRQYAFVRITNPSLKIMLSEEVTHDQIGEESVMELLASSSTGHLLSPDTYGQSREWVRLILPLQFGSDLIGAWLLGRRDPDDLYSQAEFPILQSLAAQTAMALSNIIQTERLKAMYEANINRYEQERLSLSRDLHDSVLNEMAAMLMPLDPSSLPPKFQQGYEKVIARLREIVVGLRPPSLQYGLKFALEALADNLSERSRDAVKIAVNFKSDGDWSYPEIVEHNLYRIVQEACENALKYAHTESIHIMGGFSSEKIDIKVVDDGIGLSQEISTKLDDMLANKHFGLVGMHERADLIGAEISINSKPNQGSQVQVIWKAKESI